MSLRDVIIKDILQPEINKYHRQAKGTIVYYNNKTNKATVSFSPHGHTSKLVNENVDVQLSPGIHTTGPFIGDEVILNFLNGDIKHPIIIAIIDSNYQNLTREERLKHERKGSYITDLISGMDGF